MNNNFIKSIITMKRIAAGVALIGVLITSIAFAQTNTNDSDSDKSSDTETQQQAQTNNDDQPPPQPDPGFIPSEEISEDLSVSFPTDI